MSSRKGVRIDNDLKQYSKPTFFGWIANVFYFDPQSLLQSRPEGEGRDAIEFLSLLKYITFLFIGFSLFSMIVLLPINWFGGVRNHLFISTI
jgi:hypothetical protein